MSRAVIYNQTGGPQVLRIVEQAVSELERELEERPGKVIVRVRAAGLNPYDDKMRAGTIPSSASFPRRIGADLAGTVEQVGQGAVYWDGSPIQEGDEVLGSGAGSLAEHALASACTLVRRPSALPVEVAGSLNVAGLTALSCLTSVPITESDRVLVGGASGAVGLLVAQLAVAAGATVLGTAASHNHDLLRGWGVEPVAYGAGVRERVREQLSEMGAGGLTAVIDCHGQEALEAGMALAVDPSRMVATAAGPAGAEWGIQELDTHARTAQNLAGLAERLVAGRLSLPVVRTFALDQVVEAFAFLTGRHAPGKVVVLP